MFLRLTGIVSALFFLLGSALGQNYQVVQVSNGGTIRGTVKWAGPRPRSLSLPISKDAAVCDPDNQKTRDLERLIIGADGGVANTVVYLRSVSKGKPFDFPAAKRQLNQNHCRYEPHILLVPQNSVLEMKSSDATLHTVHMEGAATYNLPFPFQNKVISRNMDNPGLVSLKCNGGHVWMNAEMFVAAHPYYAVTDVNGKFELTDVPAGQYEIVAWHEGWDLARQENAFDVLTERRVQRPIFTQPKTLEKKVVVRADDKTNVEFVFSAK